jgi:A/G-specific adenine glycosylase
MLQQTQASVVVGYFERWMARFPTIAALAGSTLQEVTKAWEGLGYYARARHLHAAAKEVVERHGGSLPRKREELEKIKGLGPYTVGAILSFAYHRKAAAVDANVLRTLARYFLIEEEIDKSRVRKKIEELTLSLLPDEEPWVVMEALIELGAKVCGKKPLCQSCPLRTSCLAYLHKKTEALPKKRPQAKITLLQRSLLILRYKEEILVGRVEDKKVMAGLFEFPYLEEVQERELLKKQIEKRWGLKASFKCELPKVAHSFTRYKAELYPTVWQVEEKRDCESYDWYTKETLEKLPFSSGHRRVLKELLKCFGK